MKRVILFAVVVFGLAACAMPQPQYKAGAVPPGPTAPPVAAGPLSQLSLGLVLDDNTKATVTALKASVDAMAAFGFLANRTAMDDVAPAQVADDLTRALGQRFRSVSLADSAAQAAQRGDDVVLTVDVKTQLGSRSGETTWVTVGGRAAAGDGAELAGAEGRGQATVPYPAAVIGFRAAWRTALAEFVGRLTAAPELAALANGKRRFAGRPAGRSAATAFPAAPRSLEFARTAERPDDVAVIIGNADYAAQGRDIPDVRPAYADAEAARRYAVQALGIREGNVIFLKDATSAQMVRVFGNERDFKGQLHDWVKAGRSRVFVYYAGHGAAAGEGSGLLVPADADGSRIELNGYPLAVLYRNLGQLPAAEVTVVLEACFSGLSQAGAVMPRASGLYVKPKRAQVPANVTVIAAGAADQVASWEQDSKRSLFTRHFLEGMAGGADKPPAGNGDGTVSLPEIRAYLDDTLTYYARRYYGRDQRAEIVDHGRPLE